MVSSHLTRLNQLLNLPEQWKFLFGGYVAVLLAYSLYIALKPYIKRIPFRKTKNITDFILIIANLSITLGGLTISLYAIGLSEGIIKMSPSDQAQLTKSISEYIYFVWGMFGILIALFILWFAQLFNNDESGYDERPINMDKLNAEFLKRKEKIRRKMERRRAAIERKNKTINQFKKHRLEK